MPILKPRTLQLLSLLFAFVLIYSCSGSEEADSGGNGGSSSGGSASGGRGGDTGTAGEGGGSFTGGSANGSGGEQDIGVSCGDEECAAFASCVEEGEMASCVCAPGYEGDGEGCTDINECEESEDICGPFASCKNVMGSYDCICDLGFVWQGSACVDVNECADDPCSINANCKNSEGSFQCTCNPNTYGNGFFCNNGFNDCADDPCEGSGTCVQAPGGHACQCDLGYEGSKSCSFCGLTLVLADPALRAAVNLQLGRESGDETRIPLSLLEDEFYLDASGLDIRDLSGLECWTSLRHLELEGSKGLKSGPPVEALSKLTRLSELNLSCTGLSDLAPLSAHPTLESLKVSAKECGGSLLDPSAAGSIRQLEYLDLSDHALSSLVFLSDTRSLRVLLLGGNQISKASDIGSLSLLSFLDLASNKLKSLDSLSRLSGLRSLRVNDNLLSNMKGVMSLPQLRKLAATGNQLTSFPNFEDLETLRELSLSNNRIASLESLADSGQLLNVYVNDNKVESLDPLLDGSFRGTLTILENPLDCETEGDTIVTLRGRGLNVVGACVEEP